MSRFTAVVFSGGLLALLISARPAAAQSDAVDTRITFILGDDNVLAGSSDFSPTTDIGPRQQIKTFFDNRQTKDNGQETKTDFVLYKKFDGPYPRLQTEASLVLRMDLFVDPLTGKPGVAFGDDGTFLQVSYYMGDLPQAASTEGGGPAVGSPSLARSPGQPPRIYALALPFNADRIRLGYSYDITWGGNPIFPKNTTGAPGLKVGWEGEKSYGWLAFKSHRQLNDMTDDLDAVYGVLGGVGYDFNENFRWEANGGWFQKGVFPPLNKSQPGPVDGKALEAAGASTQVVYHKGIPIQTSIDLRLYRNDPEFAFKAFRKEVMSPDWSYLVSAEATYLAQNLRDADHAGSTNIQPAKAGDVVVRVKKGWGRVSGDFVYRDLSFILFNVPSFTPYYDFPNAAKVTPEWFVDVGYDYYFEDLRLNPGFILGYEHPATYLGDASALASGLDALGTVVVRRQGDFEILPVNKAAADIISARLFTRWDMSDGMGLIAEVTYTRDPNATRLHRSADGTIVRQFDEANVVNRLSLALILQGRF